MGRGGKVLHAILTKQPIIWCRLTTKQYDFDQIATINLCQNFIQNLTNNLLVFPGPQSNPTMVKTHCCNHTWITGSSRFTGISTSTKPSGFHICTRNRSVRFASTVLFLRFIFPSHDSGLRFPFPTAIPPANSSKLVKLKVATVEMRHFVRIQTVTDLLYGETSDGEVPPVPPDSCTTSSRLRVSRDVKTGSPSNKSSAALTPSPHSLPSNTLLVVSTSSSLS